MEDYAAKMQLKTDAALREYVTGYTQYREDAVLAAFDELRRRGQPAQEEEALRPNLEVLAAELATRQKAAAVAAAATVPKATTDPDALAADSPALYSPVTIVLFSILPMTTMLGGGILLGMNLYRLGHKRALLGLILFIVAYLFAGSVVLTWAVLQAGLNPVIGGLLFNLPAVLVYLLWFWPRYMGGVSYRSRSILPPFFVCFLLMWGLQRAMPYLIKQQPPEVQQQFEQLMKQR